MIFSGMQKNSLINFPGYISCVLFSPGCNFDCFYCHNRSLFDGPHEILNNDSIMSFLKKRAGMLEAVVLTGGEPTLQPDLIDAMRSIKGLGYKIKLDTNGSNPQVVSEVLKSGLCDYFAIDFKAPAAKYHEICGTGADASKTKTVINMLLQNGVNFEVRTTVIPQLKKSDLLLMAKELPIVPRWQLNRYRKPEVYRPCDEERINETPYTQTEVNGLSKEMSAVQPGMVLDN